MSEMLFDIIFKGKFSNQIDKSQAVSNFGKLFKQAPEKAVLFFDGKARALKKSLPMDKANHIRGVLKKAGLRVTLQKLQSEQESSVETSLASNKNKEWDLDQPGAVIATKTHVPVPDIDTSSLKLDEVGVRFAFKDLSLAVDFDLSEMSLDEVGAVFAEKEIIEVPEFDIGDIQVDEVGVVMAKKEEVPEPVFDFDGLDVDESDTAFPQPKKTEKPDINTDGIELE